MTFINKYFSGAVLGILVAFLIAGTGMVQAQDGYQLTSGDKVKITVFGHDDLSGEFEVDPGGQISLPLIQGVQAEGLSAAQFETAIFDKLSPDYLKNPSVSVEILEVKEILEVEEEVRPFFILGEVENPGKYDYEEGLTILESVAMAGGFTYRAKQKKMTIVRADDPEKKKESATVTTEVMPGDVIEVPERRW